MDFVDAAPDTPVFGRKPPVAGGADTVAPHDRLHARDTDRASDSEPALRRLIEPLPDAAVLLNEVGQVLSCNVRFADLIGSPRSIVVGQIFASYLVEHEEARFRAFLANTLSAAGTARFGLLHMDNSVMAVHIALLAPGPDSGMSAMRCAIVTGCSETAGLSRPRSTAIHS